MNQIVLLAQQTGPQPSAGMMLIPLLIGLALAVFFIFCVWKVFEKAGQPGWASIVPIYNVIIMIRIAGLPIWYIILLIVPVVNIVINIMIIYKMMLNFGKGVGYTLGMIFLPFIFWPMLAFGSAEYCPAELANQQDESMAPTM